MARSSGTRADPLSWIMPGVSPPAASSAASSRRVSASDNRKGPDWMSALSGARLLAVTPSNITITRSRIIASARLGGKTTWISSGLPVSDRRRRTGSLLESGVLDPGPEDRPALDGLPEAVPEDEPEPLAAAAGTAPAGFKWCRPTAIEWAHNVPHSRDCRHEQMFSMSSSCRMTSPARSEVASDMTTPFSRGGVQFEDSTLPVASKARACFITSQPAALAKNASVSCKVDTRLRKRIQVQNPRRISPSRVPFPAVVLAIQPPSARTCSCTAASALEGEIK